MARSQGGGADVGGATGRAQVRTEIELPIDARSPDEFARAFEAAFARLQVAVEQASAEQDGWGEKAAAAVASMLRFAAEDPEATQILTNEALGGGAEGLARHERVIGYAAEQLLSGRAVRAENSQLPEITERALVGGLTMLVAQRLDQGRVDELPDAAPEMIEFVLTPYLGPEEAKRIAFRDAES